MKTGFYFFFALIIVCGSHNLSAQTLFTWTDEDGVGHITDREPPEGIQIEEKLYYQKQTPTKSSGFEENRSKRQLDREKSEVFERVEIEKRKAKNAKQNAEEAFERANRIKKESDEYIQKVKYKSRKRKSLRVKMKKRMEESNRAISEAEKLKQLAITAEKDLEDAESEAEKLKEETLKKP